VVACHEEHKKDSSSGQEEIKIKINGIKVVQNE
jgi:hypothetical protein